MSGNATKVSVILEPKDITSIGFTLKKMRLDYYLFFELVYRTGVQGLKILNMSVSEIMSFCEENKEYIPDILMNSIRDHSVGKKDSDYFFSATRNPSRCLSKRTIENVISRAGEEHGYPNLTFKVLSRTFMYEQLRARKYSFDAFKEFLQEKNRYFASLDKFIDYCGITKSEYKKDVKAHFPSTLAEDCDSVIAAFKRLKKQLQNVRGSGEEYRKMAELIIHVATLTDKIK